MNGPYQQFNLAELALSVILVPFTIRWLYIRLVSEASHSGVDSIVTFPIVWSLIYGKSATAFKLHLTAMKKIISTHMNNIIL